MTEEKAGDEQPREFILRKTHEYPSGRWERWAEAGQLSRLGFPAHIDVPAGAAGGAVTVYSEGIEHTVADIAKDGTVTWDDMVRVHWSRWVPKGESSP